MDKFFNVPFAPRVMKGLAKGGSGAVSWVKNKLGTKILGLFNPDGTLAGFYPNIFRPSGYTSSDIATAMLSASILASSAVVALEPVDYDGDVEIPALRGVELRCESPVKLSSTGAVPDQNFTAIGGCRILLRAGVVGVSANTTPLASVPTDIGSRGLHSFKMQNIAFMNGKSGIEIGAFQEMGPVWCSFKDLFFFNQTDAHYKFENYQHCHFENLVFANYTASSPGGAFYRNSLNTLQTPNLIPGNSHWEGELYGFASSRLGRGVVFEGRGASGSQLNEIIVNARCQFNRFGSQAVQTLSVTTANNSSNITVNEPGKIAEFPVGMPVVFATTTPTGFTQKFTYYVATNNGTNTITLSKQPLSAALVVADQTTGAGTFTLTTGGFAGLEIHGNSTSTFTNNRFGWWDIECSYNTVSVSMTRVRTSMLGINEITQSQTGTAVVLRDTSSTPVKTINPGNFTVDFDSNCAPEITNELAGTRQLTGGETLVNARHQCTLVVTNAAPQTLNVPTNILYPFKFSVIQGGAGQVTIGGTGTTVNGIDGLKTAGQYAKITVEAIARDVYVISGKAAA